MHACRRRPGKIGRLRQDSRTIFPLLFRIVTSSLGDKTEPALHFHTQRFHAARIPSGGVDRRDIAGTVREVARKGPIEAGNPTASGVACESGGAGGGRVIVPGAEQKCDLAGAGTYSKPWAKMESLPKNCTTRSIRPDPLTEPTVARTRRK